MGRPINRQMINPRMVTKMKGLIELVYDVVKSLMLGKAVKTGNKQFVDQLNTAFVAVEDAWKKVNEVGKGK